MGKPGFDLVWKHQFSPARNGQGSTPPALIDFYIGYRGFRTLGFFGTPDKVVAIDTDIARLEWEKPYAAGRGTTAACPGVVTSNVTRPLTTAYLALPSVSGAGRGTPARSGVGEPFEGAVTLKSMAPPPPPRPAPAKPAAAPAAAFSPFAPRIQWLLAVGPDGKLRSHFISNGDEPAGTMEFLPAGAHAIGLMSFDNYVYAGTTNNCGGAPSGIWALDRESKKVTSWKTTGNLAGNAGFAVGPTGTIFVGSSTGELTALEPKTLVQKAQFKAPAAITSTPAVFEFGGKDMVAVTTGDGKLHVLDAALSAPLASSAAFSAPGFAHGGVTTWQDPTGTRWILAASGGAVAAQAGFAANGEVRQGTIAAFRLAERAGTYSLQPAWISRDMLSPLTPAVVNGVVFAVSAGNRSTPAVLYALDGASGKELWSSGAAMKSFVTTGGISAGGTRVYVATQDGTQYAFGFPIEH